MRDTSGVFYALHWKAKMSSLWIAFALVMAGCASYSGPSEKWERYTVDLSGRKISFSAPPGAFSHAYVPEVNLETETNEHLTLFDRSWIFSSMVGDSGALQLIVVLVRAPIGSTDLDMLRGIQQYVSTEYRKAFPDPVILGNVNQRWLGNAEWLCYDEGVYGAQCSLRVDSNHYLSWRLREINNLAQQISVRDELAAKIEASVNIDF
jgi:hypothetical protein